MTLSAAGAAKHAVENPFLHGVLGEHQVLVTLAILVALAAVFFRGFSEAIGVANVAALPYLALNVVVLARGAFDLITHPELIAPADYERGGKASGRAIAFLAHRYLGPSFGTVYDLSTIFILGLAGASAMAGLLHVIPRYLPRYGMAPRWAALSRPMILVLVFSYTLADNCVERPDGVIIGVIFTALLMLACGVSRSMRSIEIRIPYGFFVNVQSWNLGPEVRGKKGPSRPLSSVFVRLPGFSPFASAMTLEMTLAASTARVVATSCPSSSYTCDVDWAR